jgi:intracellular sulfur oxidation DsrE/DsrF family protein
VKKQRKGTTIVHASMISTLAAGLLALCLDAHPTFAAQEPARAAVAAKKSLPLARKNHRLAVQVNVNEPAAMNLALNNASNVAQYYKERGEKVEIEIVAFGPGLHMLREDTSPVKERIKSIKESIPNISFKACGNTQQNMRNVEAKDIPLVSQATVVKSGVVRLMQLQEQGWSYIRP